MTPPITFHKSSDSNVPVFSILIPTWNNLDYLKCCVESIRRNSAYTHQIIIHVNEGNDGTLEWVRQQGFSYSHSTANAGVCYGFNAPSVLADSDYIVLSDDDFYFAPQWDIPLLEEIRNLDTIYFCITGTMIEHTVTANRCAIAPFDFGKTVKQFDEARFLREFGEIPFADWTGGNWYPMVIHKSIWQLMGGLSVEFSPGMGSDPDMMMKLWHSGVRYYKGVSASRVYHFGSRTTARIKRNNGYNQFLLKWGMSHSTFFRHFLRIGESFKGTTGEPEGGFAINVKKLKDAVRRVVAAFSAK